MDSAPAVTKLGRERRGGVTGELNQREG